MESENYNKLVDITKKKQTDIENKLVVTVGRRKGAGAIQRGRQRYKLLGIK